MAADLDVYHVYLLRRPDGTPLRAYESYDACQRDLGDALRLFGDGYTTTGVPFTPSAPPLAAPAPSAVATGEDGGPAWTSVENAHPPHEVEVEAMTSSDRRIRAKFDAMDQAWYRGAIREDVVAWRFNAATPPAAPAAATDLSEHVAVLRGAMRWMRKEVNELSLRGEPSSAASLLTDYADRALEAIQAALAAAASAERGE